MSVDQAANRVRARDAKTARGRGLTVAVAAALVGSDWVVAVKLAGIRLTVREVFEGAPSDVRLAAILVTSLVSGLAARLLIAARERFTAKGSCIWVATAVVILVPSFSGPPSAASTIGAMLVLILIHISVAAVLIAGITRRREVPA